MSEPTAAEEREIADMQLAADESRAEDEYQGALCGGPAYGHPYICNGPRAIKMEDGSTRVACPECVAEGYPEFGNE